MDDSNATICMMQMVPSEGDHLMGTTGKIELKVLGIIIDTNVSVIDDRCILLASFRSIKHGLSF